MKSIGNINSNKIYNPNEFRNPPPADLEETERDSEMEQYIRGEQRNSCLSIMRVFFHHILFFQQNMNSGNSSTSQLQSSVSHNQCLLPFCPSLFLYLDRLLIQQLPHLLRHLHRTGHHHRNPLKCHLKRYQRLSHPWVSGVISIH